VKKRLAWIAAVAAAALLMSACSKDANTSEKASGSGAGSGSVVAADPQLAAAKKKVDAALVEPTDVGVSQPLSKVPATGKNIAYLECAVGICQQLAAEYKNAAKLLGWKVTLVPQGPTPENIVDAWERALALKPDGIITSGTPVTVYQKQLDKAKSAGIPVVDYSSANKPNTPGIIGDTNPGEDNGVRGDLLAAYAASQSGGKAHSLFLNIADFPTIDLESKRYESYTKTVCPGCSVDTLNFAATDIGSKIPSAVVSYLQKNPKINWIVSGFDDIGLGVPEALKAAGLDKQAKMIGQSGSDAAAQSIKTGGVQVATIPQGVGQMAYKVLDIFARHFNGDSLSADTANLLPIWIQTKDTIGDPKDLWKGPKGYPQTFAKLWKVSA
jgi:ribose transport system substrate-binding protein